MERQERIIQEYCDNKKDFIKIACDNCGKVRKSKVITPQDYQDIYGVRCKECMEELE